MGLFGAVMNLSLWTMNEGSNNSVWGCNDDVALLGRVMG